MRILTALVTLPDGSVGASLPTYTLVDIDYKKRLILIDIPDLLPLTAAELDTAYAEHNGRFRPGTVTPLADTKIPS